MKGIILAGGSGTRLYPLTKGVSKQMLPIYDKPMIYYPISTLMLAGIREILIISTPDDIDGFKRLLGSGKEIGVKFKYAIQKNPTGLGEAFLIGEQFIGSDSVCLALGDNIFYGQGFKELLKKSRFETDNNGNASVFGYNVKDPHRYGVVEFDNNWNVLGIEEKPKLPKSNYAVVGLYFYPNDIIKKAKKNKPSQRGELEITSINNMYISDSRLKLQIMRRGYAWLDTGTPDSLTEASDFVRVLEKRQGLKIACIEEIAYDQGFIDKKKLHDLGNNLGQTEYGSYLIWRSKQ